jgi:hypothetical protein
LRDPEVPQSLQDDIGKLIDWTTKWKMAFNCSKCKIMHVGRNNPSFDYQMTDTVNDNVHTLECSTEERDLGIFVTENLKWSTHCHIASAKGNKALGILRNTFTRPSVDTMKKLYCCYVRPHLEFAVPVWAPTNKGDIKLLEQVQRRATKIADTKGMQYEDRLEQFNLQRLEDRRMRGDLIQFFKFENKIDLINWRKPLRKMGSLSTEGPASGLRGHSKRYCIELNKSNIRKNFFTNRVLKIWNKLDEEIINANSVNSFKNKLDDGFLLQKTQQRLL